MVAVHPPGSLRWWVTQTVCPSPAPLSPRNCSICGGPYGLTGV